MNGITQELANSKAVATQKSLQFPCDSVTKKHLKNA
jgi:hypothetical protein